MTLGRTIGWWLLGASLLVACSDDDVPEPVGIMWGSGASGAFVEDTVPLLAFFRDRDGNSVGDPLTGVSWSSSNPAVLAIDGDTIAIALDTGAAVLRGSISAPAFAVDVPFRVIPRWQGRLVWARSPEDGGQPRLAVQEYPSHTWRQLPDFGYPLSGTSDAYMSSDGRYVSATSTRRSSPLASSTVFVMDMVADTVWAPFNALAGEQFASAWFPGDSLIAFVAAANGRWEVFTARSDGTGIQQRTFTRQSVPPAFDVTPEGHLVIVLRGGPGHGELFEISLAGDTVAQLTATDAYEEYLPAVSPDGTTIAYVATRVDARGDAIDATRVWVMERSGANARPLLPPLKPITGRISAYPAGNVGGPSWSGDSRFVLLSWSVDPIRLPDGTYIGRSEVYAVRLLDGLAIRITRYIRGDVSPFFR